MPPSLLDGSFQEPLPATEQDEPWDINPADLCALAPLVLPLLLMPHSPDVSLNPL